MRSAVALLLACLLMAVGCTSTEQAAEPDVPEPAVEEADESEPSDTTVDAAEPEPSEPEPSESAVEETADDPGQPYAIGDDLALWVTENEITEMLRPFAARQNFGLPSGGMVLTRETWVDPSVDDETEVEGTHYHYARKPAPSGITWVGGKNWGVTITPHSTPALWWAPDAPATRHWDKWEEHQLLPNGIKAAGPGMLCEYTFNATDSQRLYLGFYVDRARGRGGVENCQTEAFSLAAGVLREMGWVSGAAVATQLVDDWTEGWNRNDVQAVLAVFTEDAVYVEGGSTIVGADRIGYRIRTSRISDAARLGEATETEAGTFVFAAEFTYVETPMEGEIEITLDGDRISRLEWLWLDETE